MKLHRQIRASYRLVTQSKPPNLRLNETLNSSLFFPHTDQDSSRTLGSPALRAPEAATDLVGGWTVLMMVGWRWVWHEMELVFLAEMPCYICFNRCAFDPLTCQEGQANLASVEGIAKR